MINVRDLPASYNPAAVLDQYLATLPPMQAGKARKALDRQQGFNGKLYKRHIYAESLARKPHARVNYDKNRVYTGEETFFDIASVTWAFADYLVWLIEQNRAAT